MVCVDLIEVENLLRGDNLFIFNSIYQFYFVSIGCFSASELCEFE